MTISIVLYGRNDNYGYNLHKRAALSLNCMAAVLTDPADEILFVDYNTPDDFPTFPEAIQDTLTKRARDILRILRVRPRMHERFRARTHLLALEPVARNVGVRHSNAANRWILSTNTDMVFVPQGTSSLSDLARDLSPGFYHAPRIEIPELLWEGFDRQDPEATIRTIREWGSTLHLNEIILASKYILYDGPGDFQLLLRNDLFAHHGFHEEMLLGWHVDSNIARRMYVKYGAVGDLGGQVYGYHCDHTRQVTAAHGHLRLQNDWRIFCDQVDTADIPEQADSWGCVSEPIEEVRLASDPTRVYVQALREAIGEPLGESRTTKFALETFNKIDYDVPHVVPFLADMFATMPKNSNVAWYGARTETLSSFSVVWDRLAFSGKILADRELIQLNESTGTPQAASTVKLLNADVFVFDFGGLPGSPDKSHANNDITRKLLHRFMQVVHEERRRFSVGLAPRRLIALNAINNHFEWLVRGYVAAAATPCATHMRHGFVLPAEAKENWVPLLYTGQAGIRSAHHLINSDPRYVGIIAYGPYKYLPAGSYRLCTKIELAAQELGRTGNEPCIGIDLRAGAEVLAVFLLRREQLRNADHEFIFEVTSSAADIVEGVEARIRLFNQVALTIRSLTLETVPATAKAAAAASILSPPIALGFENWLPYLSTGALGRLDGPNVVAQSGPADFVVYGPNWPLPANWYEAILCIDDIQPQQADPSKFGIKADVLSGEQQLAAAIVSGLDAGRLGDRTVIRLPFEVGVDTERRQIETRMWSAGESRFRIRSLEVRPLGQTALQDLLAFLLLGKAGERTSIGITSVPGLVGTLAYSPALRVRPGAYRLSFKTGAEAEQSAKPRHGCVIAQVTYGSELLAACEMTPGGAEGEAHSLEFEVPANPDPTAGLQLSLKVVSPAEFTLCALSIEPAELNLSSRKGPAFLNLQNWIPFVQTGAGAHREGDTIIIDPGPPSFAVYGPYWILPAGHYELRVSVISRPQDVEQDAVTCQVAVESGAHIIAESKWRLNRYRNAGTAVEFRLPFHLREDSAAAARTIETRIFTPGTARFRVQSLAVVLGSEEAESNWFAYLIVGSGGIHCGDKIKSLPDQAGCLASTSARTLAPGHYQVLPDISNDFSRAGAIWLEIWSGSDLIALDSIKSADQVVDFDVADDNIGRAIEMRIQIAAAAEVTLNQLNVKRVSTTIDPAWRERLARAQRQGQPKLAPAQGKSVTNMAARLPHLLRVVADRAAKCMKRPKH